MTFLGVDKYEDLPIIFKKTEQQMSNIQIKISELTNDIDILEEKKQILNKKIAFLEKTEEKTSNDRDTFQEVKRRNISALKTQIKELEDDILTKRDLFIKLQPSTDKYLQKLSETYLADYVNNKNKIDSSVQYNEKNITKLISNVQDYYKLIQMFEQAMKEKDMSYGDRESERIRKEIKIKLENFNSKKMLNSQLYESMRTDSKSGLNYEEIIKKSSDLMMSHMFGSSNTSISMQKDRKDTNL